MTFVGEVGEEKGSKFIGVGYGSIVTMSPRYKYWSFNLY